MRRRLLRALRSMAAISVFVPSATAVVIGVKVWQRVERSLTPPRQVASGDVELEGLEDVTIATHDGVALSGWYVPSRNGAAIVFGHGHGAHRGQLLPAARALIDRGYGALLFDWRGHGASGGVRSTWGVEERRDFDAALDFLVRQRDVQSSRIGAVGFSMGAMIIGDVAARDSRVAAIVLMGAAPSLSEEMRHDERRWGAVSGYIAELALRREGISPDSLRPIERLCSLSPRPLLVIGGSADDQIPVGSAERMYAAACAPKSLWVIPGATHDSYETQGGHELHRRLEEFFDAALASRPATSNGPQERK
jgi:uncharacterized protein